jgi:hypothetical protein
VRTTHTLRVACEPGELPAVIEELEARGFRVECAALTERLRRRERDALLGQALELMPGPRL